MILGKTNVPLGLGDWQSYNEIYGTTNNPYDLGRTPGRLLRRIVGGAGRRLRPALARLRYRRLAAGAGVPLRRLRPQADLRAGAEPRPHAAAVAAAAARPRSGGDRADGALGRRPFAAARRDRRARSAGSRQRPTSSRCRRRATASLKDFRVLVIDSDPVMPTDKSVRGAIEKLAANLGKAGRQGRAQQPVAARLRRVAPALYADADVVPRRVDSRRRPMPAPGRGRGKLAADDISLPAERLRGIALSHRDWLMADGGADAAARAMARAVQELRRGDLPGDADAGLSARSFGADQEQRRIRIDGKDYVYPDQLAWPGIATLPGLPATAIPIGFVGRRLAGRRADRRPLAGRPHAAETGRTDRARIRRLRAAADVR